MRRTTGRSRRTTWLLLLPCLVLLATTLPHLNQGDFRRDTGRYAAVGLYMWDGGSLGRPYINADTPYFNKPPLALWIHGLFLKVFGREVAVARVPSVLAALGVVCFTVLVARGIGSRSEAVVSGLVLALTYEFFRRTREISLDFWQLFFVMWAACLVVWGAKENRKLLLIGSGVPLGFALLCKPLVAFAFVPLLAVWLWLFKRPRLIMWLVVGAVPVAVLVALPWHWHMYAYFGDAFLGEYLFHQVVDRAAGRMTNEPVTFYARTILLTYWPWLMVLGFAVWHRYQAGARARKPARDLVLLGSIWSLYVFIVLTVFPDKKPNYALPIYPGLSWMVAAGLCRLPWSRLRGWYASGFRVVGPAAVGLLGVLSLAPIQFQRPPDRQWIDLAQWLRQQSVRSGELAQTGLTTNDLCLFYMRTGWWPARAPEDGSVAPLLLTRLDEHQPTTNRVVFQSGKLAVLSPAPTEGALP